VKCHWERGAEARGALREREPLENEHHNPINGDSLQQTTGGLMVWRNADNWTAFTNGRRTWVNDPFGAQERANSDRFPWEAP
jgi:hypothetical protein